MKETKETKEIDWQSRCAGALVGAAILRADLAAALLRAEQAEKERDELREASRSLRLSPGESCDGCGKIGRADGRTPHGPGCSALKILRLVEDLAAACREREEAWAAARWAGSLQEAAEAERDAARGERDRLLEALGMVERRLEVRGPHNTEDGRSTWICEICRAVREDSRPAKHGAGCPFAARAALEKANG